PMEKLRWLDTTRVQGLEEDGTDAADIDDDAVRGALDCAVVSFPSAQLSPAGQRDNEPQEACSGESRAASQSEDELRPPKYSDDGLALHFASVHKADLRFVAATNKWFHWNGSRWREDTTLSAFDQVRSTCRHAAIDALATTQDPAKGQKLAGAIA